MPHILSDAARIEDLCWGLTFFGTGGGGRLESGLEVLRPVIGEGRTLALFAPDELPADCLVCWAVIVGGKEPAVPPPPHELAQFGLVREVHPGIVGRLAAAVRHLEAHTGRRVGALVSLELSSAATAATIMTADGLGIPVLDSDFVGRAIPELPLTKLELCGCSPFPVVMLDRWGNRVAVEAAVGTPMLDRLGRMVSRAAFGGGIATVGNLMPLEDARPALVRSSLRRAIEVGAALRQGATASGESKIRPLIEATGGIMLARGRVSECRWRDTEPYTFRELSYTISKNEPPGEIEIWIKNEHHVVWRDGTVIATSPDIIAVLDSRTNRPLTSMGEVEAGMDVTVFAMQALDPVWETPEGQALLGPRHFGFDFDPVRPAWPAGPPAHQCAPK